jgi:hypothetical protein
LALDLALDELDPTYRLDQVKEKFGGLRFYATPKSAEAGIGQKFDLLIDLAEEVCWHICDVCGKAGELRKQDRYRLRTLCMEHDTQRGVR